MRLALKIIIACLAILLCTQTAAAQENNTMSDADRQLQIDQTLDQVYLSLDGIVALEVVLVFIGMTKQLRRAMGRR